MTESDLKRYLVKSLRAQEGVGHRIEDKYKVGWPDLIMIPKPGPVFFLEAKLMRQRTTLFCTELQEYRLKELKRSAAENGAYYVHAAVIGYSEKRAALYIGDVGESIDQARYVQRPNVLDSIDWPITELLGKYHLDRVSGRRR